MPNRTYEGPSSDPSKNTFKKIETAGTQGIAGTTHKSGFLASDTIARKACTMTTVATMHTLSNRHLLNPGGANFQRRVKASDTAEKAARKASVGKGVVLAAA